MSRKQYSHCGLIAWRLDVSHQMSGICRKLYSCCGLIAWRLEVSHQMSGISRKQYSYCGLIAWMFGGWMFLTKCLEFLENNIHIVVSLLGCLEVGGVSPKPISG